MAGRPAGFGHRTMMAGGPNARGIRFGTGFRNPSFPISFRFPHRRFFGARFRNRAFGFPWLWAYYPLDSGYSDYDDSYSQQLLAYQLAMMNNQQQIEQRISALEDRVERLLTESSASAAPAPPARPAQQSKSEPSRPAVLVYRDGHTQEVENYAIVGHTLWILNEQQASKVPLSMLDLRATRRANEARDVDLALPDSNT